MLILSDSLTEPICHGKALSLSLPPPPPTPPSASAITTTTHTFLRLIAELKRQSVFSLSGVCRSEHSVSRVSACSQSGRVAIADDVCVCVGMAWAIVYRFFFRDFYQSLDDRDSG